MLNVKFWLYTHPAPHKDMQLYAYTDKHMPTQVIERKQNASVNIVSKNKKSFEFCTV